MIGVFFGVVLIVLLAIPILGSCWHLFYGDAISYADWRVPVPKGFYVRNSTNGPTMWKQTFGVPFFDVPYAHISLFRRPQPFAFDTDYFLFKQGLMQAAAEEGYELKAERTTQVNDSVGYCLEFTKAQRTLLRCAVQNSPIVFFYEGDARYIREALSTFEGMSPHNSQ